MTVCAVTSLFNFVSAIKNAHKLEDLEITAQEFLTNYGNTSTSFPTDTTHNSNLISCLNCQNINPIKYSIYFLSNNLYFFIFLSLLRN